MPGAHERRGQQRAPQRLATAAAMRGDLGLKIHGHPDVGQARLHQIETPAPVRALRVEKRHQTRMRGVEPVPESVHVLIVGDGGDFNAGNHADPVCAASAVTTSIDAVVS